MNKKKRVFKKIIKRRRKRYNHMRADREMPAGMSRPIKQPKKKKQK